MTKTEIIKKYKAVALEVANEISYYTKDWFKENEDNEFDKIEELKGMVDELEDWLLSAYRSVSDVVNEETDGDYEEDEVRDLFNLGE